MEFKKNRLPNGQLLLILICRIGGSKIKLFSFYGGEILMVEDPVDMLRPEDLILDSLETLLLGVELVGRRRLCNFRALT